MATKSQAQQGFSENYRSQLKLLGITNPSLDGTTLRTSSTGCLTIPAEDQRPLMASAALTESPRGTREAPKARRA